MGIPRLVSRLKQAGLGTTKELGRTGEPPHGTKAIIDAPSLAYYIFNILEARSTSSSTLEPTTTYEECAREAVRWLEKLEAFGFTIEVIYFDGALPLTKRSTREARMTNYVKGLQDLYNAYEQSTQKVRSGGRTSSDDVWDDAGLLQAKKKAPPPAFLVPAILEALASSRYKDRTYVMPDEADKFCVLTARRLCQKDPASRLAIFSNDSDLLVYDIGQQTKIIPFGELRFSTEKPAVMSGLEIWPSHFATGLGSETLLKLAFWMSQHPTMSAADAQKKVESENVDEDYGFQAFLGEYELGRAHEKASESKDEQRELYYGIDPRVSELIIQTNGDAGFADHKYLKFYGPVLLEDPTQRSSWNFGTGLRELAYNVLRQASGVPDGKVVVEYWRAADHVKLHECNLLDQSDLTQLLAHSCDILRKRQDWHTVLTDVEAWRCTVMHMALNDLQQARCPLPSPTSVVHVLAGRKSSQWDLVHLAAQYQAMYYSLRMLYQILRYIHLSAKADAIRGSIANSRAIDMIRSELEELPTISAFFETAMETMVQSEVKFLPLVEAQMTELDPEWRSRQEKPKKGKKRSRKASGSKEVRKRAMPAQDGDDGDEAGEGALSSNPFAMLGEE